MNIKIETNLKESHLLDLLVYDSEVKKFLSYSERIEINQARVKALEPIVNNYIQSFDKNLFDKMIKVLKIIKKTGWENPEYYYEDTGYEIKKDIETKTFNKYL